MGWAAHILRIVHVSHSGLVCSSTVQISGQKCLAQPAPYSAYCAQCSRNTLRLASPPAETPATSSPFLDVSSLTSTPAAVDAAPPASFQWGRRATGAQEGPTRATWGRFAIAVASLVSPHGRHVRFDTAATRCASVEQARWKFTAAAIEAEIPGTSHATIAKPGRANCASAKSGRRNWPRTNSHRWPRCTMCIATARCQHPETPVTPPPAPAQATSVPTPSPPTKSARVVPADPGAPIEADLATIHAWSVQRGGIPCIDLG